MSSARVSCRSVRTVGAACLASLVALMLADGGVASETSSTVVLSYTVQHAQAAPVIDGVLDDPAWDGIETQRLEWEVDHAISWTHSVDLEASFQATWRDGSLYLALGLQDDEILSMPLSPMDSDHLVIEVEDRAGDNLRIYTVPIYDGSSLEDPATPFVAWSPDGRVCELSLDTEAMYTDRRELNTNLIYADFDSAEATQRIGWVPKGPAGMELQLGSFVFADGLSADSKLVTTWGKMKTLY